MIVQFFVSSALFVLVQPFAVWKNIDSKFRRTCSDVSYIPGGSLPIPTNTIGNPIFHSKVMQLMQSSNGNIALENVLNTRDIESACSNILPGKVFRAGCVSNASQSDVNFFHQLVGMKSWIDLRSAAEHEEDERLNSEVYEGYQSFHYNRKTNKFETNDKPADKKRYFVSLMSESLIRKGIFYRLRKRNKFKVLAWFPLSVVSRRAYRRMKSVFIKEINDGGLSLLNQMVLEASGKAITAVLKLIADDNNLPTALFCTAGKDRTGLIAMLVLTILGANDEAIIRDYELSDSAYRDINNKRAMVASLSQSDLNPDIFLRARGQVMRDTMKYIRQKYGSINDFLDKYEFDESWRQKLRDVLMVKYVE